MLGQFRLEERQQGLHDRLGRGVAVGGVGRHQAGDNGVQLGGEVRAASADRGRRLGQPEGHLLEEAVLGRERRLPGEAP